MKERDFNEPLEPDAEEALNNLLYNASACSLDQADARRILHRLLVEREAKALEEAREACKTEAQKWRERSFPDGMAVANACGRRIFRLAAERRSSGGA